MPSSAARAFIISANTGSEPPTNSATATAASLALHTQMALISSSRVNCSPGSSQIWLPPILKACSLMGTISVMEIFPASTASSVSSSVMILVIDAMGTSASGSFSYRMSPVSMEMRIALRHGISNCGFAKRGFSCTDVAMVSCGLAAPVPAALSCCAASAPGSVVSSCAPSCADTAAGRSSGGSSAVASAAGAKHEKASAASKTTAGSRIPFFRSIITILLSFAVFQSSI